MLQNAEKLVHYAVAVLAAFICAIYLAAFRFWLLPPGDDGTIGMGIEILVLLPLASCVLIPLAIKSTHIRIGRAVKQHELWKQSTGQTLSVVLSFGILSLFLRSNILSVRALGGILACSVIVFELLPRRRLWGMF